MGQYFLTKKPLSAPNLSVPICSWKKWGHSKQFDIYDSFKKWYNTNYKKIRSIIYMEDPADETKRIQRTYFSDCGCFFIRRPRSACFGADWF